MSSTADVTIIVPTFNRATYLPESLSSLLGQQRSAREIIVVDDGSTDTTPAVLASFEDRVRVVRKVNGGKSTALNMALGLARGAAVWIFDDDDIAMPDALERLSDALDGAPEAGFACGDLLRFREHGNQRTFTRPSVRPAPPDDFYFQQLTRMSVFQGAMLVRRQCYAAVGPFDETLPRAQDYDMLLRLARAFAPVVVPAVIFHQRQHDEARGTAALRIDGREVWQRQAAFDARVVGKAHRDASLAEILPRSQRTDPLPPERAFDALLRRAATIGRRGEWHLAALELDAALALADAHGLNSVTPATLHALADTFLLAAGLPAPDGERMLARVGRVPSRPLRVQLLRALTWQMFLSAGKDAARGRLGRALGTMRRYVRATHGHFVGAHLAMLVEHAARGRPKRIEPPRTGS